MHADELALVVLLACASTTLTSPVDAPPVKVAVKGLAWPQVAATALMPCSQRPLLMVMVAPESTGVMVNSEPPNAPVVVVGLPWQNSIVPAMPPQIWSSATFVSCVSSCLRVISSTIRRDQ